MSKIRIFLDKYHTAIGGTIAVKLFWATSKLFFRTHYERNFIRPLSRKETVIFASNHASMLDPPAIFSALPTKRLFTEVSPIKFMTATKYYNSWMRPFLYTTGCFPHKGPGLTGVQGSLFYARHGYRVFVFPEGKLNPTNKPSHAYEGISRILDELPNARLVLVYIYWQKRKKFFSRPVLSVSFSDTPDSVNKKDPMSIMNAIYDSAPTIASEVTNDVAYTHD